MKVLILKPKDVVPPGLQVDGVITVFRDRPEEILTALLNRMLKEETILEYKPDVEGYISIEQLIISTIQRGRKEKKTFEEIAELLGVSGRTIYRWKAKLKIE